MKGLVILCVCEDLQLKPKPKDTYGRNGREIQFTNHLVRCVTLESNRSSCN